MISPKSLPITVHLTKVDSLQTELQKMHLRVDSLSEVLNRYTIAKDYFHDILGGQVTTFVGIITIIVAFIALLSWGIILDPLKKELTANKQEFHFQLTNQTAEFEKFRASYNEKMDEFKIKQIKLALNTFKTLYKVTNEAKQYEDALRWGFVIVSYELKIGNEERAVRFLTTLTATFLDKKLSKEHLLRLKKIIEENYSDVLTYKRPKVDDLITPLYDNFNKIIYRVETKD